MDISSIISAQNTSNLFNSTELTGIQSKSENTIPFQSLLTDAIDDVNTTGNDLELEAYKVATGETDNLHDVTIASTKYSLAVDLFIQIRNKTLDSYNQIMNMNV